MSDQAAEYDDVLPRSQEDVRISRDETDDLPVSPPDSQPRGGEYLGGDAAGTEETIEQRIMQEVPDPDSAYGAPDNESGLDGPARMGGDDPDAIPADRDVLGQDDSLDTLEDPDAVGRTDEDLEMMGREPDAESPEQSALHIEEA